MTESLPPPMTPPDADLRDFKFYPVDVVRFAQSGLVTLEDPPAVLAAVLLWGAAWHNTPAGSLDDNDRQLAQLAGYGRAVEAWQAVRAGALRGWVKCSDGRLYHPVVAQKVEEAWRGKLKQRWRTYCGAIRQHNGRNPHDERDSPSFEDWLEQGRPTTVVRGRKVPQQEDLPLASDDSRADARPPARAPVSGGENVTRDRDGESRATNGNVTRDNGGESRSSHAHNGSKGQGERQGQGQGDSRDSPLPPAPDLMQLTQQLASAGAVSIISPSRIARAMDVVKKWVAEGIDVETVILPAIAKKLADMPESETVGCLSYFDPEIRKRLALADRRKGRSREPAKPASPLTEADDDDERIDHIRGALSRDCGARTYEGWLAPGRTAMTVNGTGLVVKARAGFMADWVAEHFGGKLDMLAKAEGLAGARIVGI